MLEGTGTGTITLAALEPMRRTRGAVARMFNLFPGFSARYAHRVLAHRRRHQGRG